MTKKASVRCSDRWVDRARGYSPKIPNHRAQCNGVNRGPICPSQSPTGHLSSKESAFIRGIVYDKVWSIGVMNMAQEMADLCCRLPINVISIFP